MCASLPVVFAPLQVLQHHNPITGYGEVPAVVELLHALERSFGQLKVDAAVSLGLAVGVAVHHGRHDLAAGGECSSQQLVRHVFPDELYQHVGERSANWSLLGGNVVRNNESEALGPGLFRK
jgi:hypothetical protein